MICGVGSALTSAVLSGLPLLVAPIVAFTAVSAIVPGALVAFGSPGFGGESLEE